MANIRSYAVIGILSIATAGCATMSVSSHVQRGLDFSSYRTYDWGPADALPTGDPRLEDNAFFKDHILGAVEKTMAAKGFIYAANADKADLLIHYHAAISRRLDVDRIDQERGYCFDQDCRARVIEYEAGTLVLDVIDARTNRVIWRGWAQDTVEPVLRNEDRMAREIEEAVRRMLARFPNAL
jgi:hypothetical protein